MSGKTVVFFPEGAYGPTNNCVGIGDVLRAHGHRVVFIIEESFAGTLEARGFEERLMRLGPPPEEPEVPGQFWKDFIRDTAPVFRTPTIDQLESFIQPTYEALIDGSRFVNPRLEEIIAEAAARRDRRGQRGRVRRAPGQRRAVGADRLLQPAGGARSRDRTGVLGAAAGRPLAVGRVPRRVSAHAPGDVAGVQRVHAGGRRACRCPSSSSCSNRPT